MALDKITTTMITDEAVTTAKLGPSAVTGAKIGADAIDISDLGTIMSVGETAPSSPFIGQRWYRASTAITYQYTNDGTSSFWLDVSSGGIGTSADRGVDFVGDVDPHKSTNLGSVGSVYYNRVLNRHFVCTTATTDAQVWSGRYSASGGIISTYTSGGNVYRVHTFLSNGEFIVEDITSVDILIIAGGGGAGASDSGGIGSGGGGGAGGVKWYPAYSVTPSKNTIIIGAGGTGSTEPTEKGTNGGDSKFNAIIASGGGGGGTQNTGVQGGLNGGSGGGGGQRDNSNANFGSGITNQGNNGGSGFEGSYFTAGGGGGAGGAAPNTTTSGIGGAGGAGIVEGTTALHNWTTGSGTVVVAVNGTGNGYAGGGGGASTSSAGAATHGGGAGSTSNNGGADGTANTGGGGGGDDGSGGSGIVIIRYIEITS